MDARPLTKTERAALSPGLAAALETAGAEPAIIGRAAWPARVSALWRGHVPVLTHGSRIYWPNAPADASVSPAAMALLQHELQHVLDYATGRLTALGYLLDPRNWRYRLPPPERWDWRRLGAEQRAVVAETLWRAERGLCEGADHCRRTLPWADKAGGI